YTYRDLEKTMKKLAKAGIKGFILDLRFNPGGLLDSAVKISDMFIDDGLIVTIRPRHGPETSYIGKSDGSYLTFPMVCLVNGYSASGSEIVAACLQDRGRPDRRAQPDTAKADFRDRQLQMALEYLRGQIRTAAKGQTPKKAG